MNQQTDGTFGLADAEDPSTIQGKFMVGYQGWFACPGDGEPVKGAPHGWLHWLDRPLGEGGRITFEAWPDISELDDDELYPVPGLTLPPLEGSSEPRPAKLFSSRNIKTVNRHYRWMREHKISGTFVQRFATEAQNKEGGFRNKCDLVLQNAREAANRNGRVWTVMYDITGLKANEAEEVIKEDYAHLINDLRITKDPMLLHEAGKPVVAIWGMGMKHNPQSAESLSRLLQWMHDFTPEGVYIFAGSPSHWRTRDGDCSEDEAYLKLWQQVDCMSPWYVGRFGTIEDATSFKHKMAEDMAYLKEEDARLHIKRDFSPVVFPGFSWRNLNDGPFNEIPREGGTFLYNQLYNAMDNGANIIYGAMFDEYDEATALMPITTSREQTPQEIEFLTLDEDGMELPSDWYLRICALAADALQKGAKLPGSFPFQALMAYQRQIPSLDQDVANLHISEPIPAPKVVPNAIRSLLRSLSPPVELNRVDQTFPKPVEAIDQYKFESTTKLVSLRNILSVQPTEQDLSSPLLLEIWLVLFKLDGAGELFSAESRKLVQDCLACLPESPNIYTRLLSDGVKPVFAANPHPEVSSETGRKLPVSSGGERARHEIFNDQQWKQPSGWGIVNVLRNCLQRMTEQQISEDIALILPPLLTILDDYETWYRMRGLECLTILLEKMSPAMMKRMGIDKLFLKSIQHSISLHPSPPNPPILVLALEQLFKLLPSVHSPLSSNYADEIALAVEHGIKDGWQYAPSGMDGVDVLVEIGNAVEFICDKVGVGMIRWLNDLIPGLLSSSYLPPSPYSVGVQLSNLHALHTLLDTIQSTGRADLWRGQIIDALARNWVGIDEKLKLMDIAGTVHESKDGYEPSLQEMKLVQELLRLVLADLIAVRPDMKENECKHLLELSSVSFGGLVEGFVSPSPDEVTTPSLATPAAGPALPPRPPAYQDQTHNRQPPVIPPRPGQNQYIEVQGLVQAQPPQLPARNSAATNVAESGNTRFVPPIPARGMLKPVQAPPPKRTIERPESPDAPESGPSTRMDQARQQATNLYGQYSPMIEEKRKEAQRAANNLGGMAGKFLNQNQKPKETSQGVTMKDVERMGQKAVWGLGKVGNKVAGGIERLQQQQQQNQGR